MRYIYLIKKAKNKTLKIQNQRSHCALKGVLLVDDVSSSIKEKLVMQVPEPCNSFLGADISSFEVGDYRVTLWSMMEYANGIVDSVQEVLGVPVENRDCPARVQDEQFPQEGPSRMTSTEVASFVGMALWYARNVRPDITYAVCYLCEKVTFWNRACEIAMLQLAGYIKMSANKGVVQILAKNENERFFLSAHCDANWKLPKSRSGVYIFIAGTGGSRMPLQWISKKQPICADSAGSAETVAAHLAMKELLGCLGMCPGLEGVGIIHTDSNAVVGIKENGYSSALQATAKAVGARNNFFKDVESLGLVKVQKVAGVDQAADSLTKALSSPAVAEARKMMMVFDEEEIKNELSYGFLCGPVVSFV